MTSAALDSALTDTESGLCPLPRRAEQILRGLAVPPRLGAHLRAVHDVAKQLIDWLAQRYPALTVDQEAVLFGAATHDIGKTIHTDELRGPGNAHEQVGYRILLEQGVEERMARFARTHAGWAEPDAGIEDLLVSLADKIWKGKRVNDLERLIIGHLAAATREEPWAAFMELDDFLTGIAAGADRRLAFQAGYPISN